MELLGLDRILDFNKQFPLELLTIGDMERISGLSARTIQYLFQAKLGCTPIKWLRNKRLEIAKNLILSTNISITELSLKLGFPSLSIFSKYYKEYFNELPSQTSKKS
ncbi:MAG: helix-turn-helix transcriptional regulator [Candidatus Paceibacteria bacterium]